MTLPTRPLGRSGMDITRLGFGSWAVGGGGWAFGWGPQDDNASLDDATRAGPGSQLDRHRSGVWARAFGESRGTVVARDPGRAAAFDLHEVRAGLERARSHARAAPHPDA